MAANANTLEEVSPLDQAASNLVRAYTEKRPGAADAAINFYATLQEKCMSPTELVNYRELGFIAITEADKAHLPGAQDAAAALNAAILDDHRVNRNELPNYKYLETIANNIGIRAEFTTSATGVADGSIAFTKQVVNTPAAILSGMQQGESGIISRESAAKVMSAAYELAKDPLAIVKQLYHKTKDDGGNLNMDERHARAALYRLPAEDRVAALKVQTWQGNLNADSMLVGIPAAKAAPGAWREAGAAVNALASEAANSKLVGAGVAPANWVEGLPAEQDAAKANIMATTGSVQSNVLKSEANTLETNLVQSNAAIITGAEADAVQEKYALLKYLRDQLNAEHEALEYQYQNQGATSNQFWSRFEVRSNSNHEQSLAEYNEGKLTQEQFHNQMLDLDSPAAQALYAEYRKWDEAITEAPARLKQQERGLKLMDMAVYKQEQLVMKTVPGSAALNALDLQGHEFEIAEQRLKQGLGLKEAQASASKDIPEWIANRAALDTDPQLEALRSAWMKNLDHRDAAAELVDMHFNQLSLPALPEITGRHIIDVIQTLDQISTDQIAHLTSPRARPATPVDTAAVRFYDEKVLREIHSSLSHQRTDNIVLDVSVPSTTIAPDYER